MEDTKIAEGEGLKMIVNNGVIPMTKPKSVKLRKYDSEIEMALVRHLNHDASIFRFKTKIDAWIWFATPGAEPQIVQLFNDKCLRVVSTEHIAALLTHELAESSINWDFKRTNSDCRKAVALWSRQAAVKNPRTLKEWPKAIAFEDYDGLAFNRLWFTPHIIEWPGLCQHAPFFFDLKMRMHNFNVFAAKVYSIYLGAAGRKKVLWIDGIANSGKSFVLYLLNEIFGGINGCFTLSPKAMRSPHYGESLIGKSLVMVNEASSNFLRSEEFKALTGDSLAEINPKGKKMYQGKFDFHMVFASNEPPEIPKDEAILTRLLRCHMHCAVPASKRIDERELYEQIKPQIPYFLGYGKFLYESLGQLAFESDDKTKDDLNLAVSTFQTEEQELFDRCFLVKADARISSAAFITRFNDCNGTRSRVTEKQMRKFIKNNYEEIEFKQARDSGNRGYFFIGMKSRLDETSHKT